MADDPNSLRFRIFGPKRPTQNERGDVESDAGINDSESHDIASVFKASIVDKIPECSNPKPPPSPGRRERPFKRARTEIHPGEIISANLKDAYAKRCAEIHLLGNKELEKAREDLLQELGSAKRKIIHDAEESIERARESLELKQIGRVRIECNEKGNHAEDINESLEKYKEKRSSSSKLLVDLENELEQASREVQEAFHDLVSGGGTPGQKMIHGIQQIEEETRKGQESIFRNMQKLLKESEEDLLGKDLVWIVHSGHCENGSCC